jgi:hypothetical protein
VRIGSTDEHVVGMTGELETPHRSSCLGNKIYHMIHITEAQGGSHRDVMSSLAWQILDLQIHLTYIAYRLS